jgi:two-component system, LuxR family, sensor kinase FixL
MDRSLEENRLAHSLHPRAALIAGGFVAAYVAADWVSYIHPMQESGITPWNPQPALAIALLMLAGQRAVPLVFIATLAAEWLVRGIAGGWPSALLVAAVLSLGYAAIAHALTHRFAISPALTGSRDTWRLVAVVAAGALVTGALFVGSLVASRIGPVDQPFRALLRFWIGDAVGILVTLPLLLMASVPARREEMRRMLRSRDAPLLVAGTVLALLVVFASSESDQVKFFYVLFLPLIAASVRHGLAGTVIAAVVIQGAVIISGEMAGYQALTIFEFQALLIALTVTGLFLGISVDERRRAERDLRATLRLAAAGEMAAALAHELNQPLTALSTYARASQLLAASKPHDPAELQQVLEKLAVEAHRAADVVRRLRDFFRTGATRLHTASLAELAAAAIETQRVAADACDVQLALMVEDGLPASRVDETQMHLVLRNLLANGIEAARSAPGERRVRVELGWEPAGGVRGAVIDSGPGVAPADVERIFEPFESRRPAGMGMGLTISRAIVEAHGGRLWAEAGAPGTFRFTLPSRERQG